MMQARPQVPVSSSHHLPRRRGFGLDTLLPGDAAIIEAQILRLLAEQSPEVLIVRPSTEPDRPSRAGHRAVPAFLSGTPDLLLLLPGGKTACMKIKTQAEDLSPQQLAFADLCRQNAIPYAVVRSLGEAKAALIRFGLPGLEA